MTRTCETNIVIPYRGEDVTVSLHVEFEVSPPDPSVGIFGCGIEEFTAKVVDADVENATPAMLAELQVLFDFAEEAYRDEIDEACLESLDDGSDDRSGY